MLREIEWEKYYDHVKWYTKYYGPQKSCNVLREMSLNA